MADTVCTQVVADVEQPIAGRPRLGWVPIVVLALAALVVGLTLTGGAPRPAPAGLPDPGEVSGWAAPMLRVLLDLSAVGVVGSLLAAGFLLPALKGTIGTAGHRAMRAAGLSAGVWAGVSVCLFVTTTSQALGRPFGELLGSPSALTYGLELPEGRALVGLGLIALGVALNARAVATRPGGQVLLLLAVAGMFPLLLTGHAASSSDHYWATQALLVHVLGATFWVGGLLALLLLVRDRADLRVAAPRFSALALVCFVAVAVSGTAAAALQLGSDPENLLSGYGVLVLAKAVALVLLGSAGWMHRRRAIPSLLAGRRRAFLRLAWVEGGVMAAAVGLAVALSRTAPPPGVLGAAGATHGGFSASVRGLPPLDLEALLTQWRPDAIVVTVLLVSAGAYLHGVHHLRRTGLSWSRRRTAAMMSGLVLTLMMLCSGVATYANAVLSMQTVQVLTLAVTTPILVTTGRPVLLFRTCNGQPTDELRSGWLRGLADPVNGLATLLAVLTVLYATPLLGLSLRNPAAQLLVAVAALVGGLLFFWPLLGKDWVPAPRPSKDRFMLSVFAVLLAAALMVVLVRSGSSFEKTWFEELDLWWEDSGSDRRWAATVAGGHVGLLCAVAFRLGLDAHDDKVLGRQ